MIEAMQQTDKYKLNKPGEDDPIAIAPLNENMDKVEGALEAQDARITMLEAKYMVFGTYVGDGQRSQFIDLGFTPVAVIAQHTYVAFPGGVAVRDQPDGIGAALEITENGFLAINTTTNDFQRNMNTRTQTINYIAFA